MAIPDEVKYQYYDADGNECTLYKLCGDEPGWAASRITTLQAKLAEAEEEKRVLRERAIDEARYAVGIMPLGTLRMDDRRAMEDFVVKHLRQALSTEHDEEG